MKRSKGKQSAKALVAGKVTVAISFTLTMKEVEDAGVLWDAFSSMTRNWAKVLKCVKPTKGTVDFHDYPFHPGGSVIIRELNCDEDDPAGVHTLDLAAIKNGLTRMAKKAPGIFLTLYDHCANDGSPDYDGYTADALVQFAVFGEVVYG